MPLFTAVSVAWISDLKYYSAARAWSRLETYGGCIPPLNSTPEPVNSRLHCPYSVSSSPSPRGALSTAQVLSGTSFMSVTEILFSGTTAITLPTQLAIDTTAIVESRSFPSAPGFTVVGFTPTRSIFILPTGSSDPGDTGPSTAVLPSLLAVLGVVAVAIGTLLCWMGRWKPRRIRMSLASGRAPRGESRHKHAQRSGKLIAVTQFVRLYGLQPTTRRRSPPACKVSLAAL